MKIILRSTNKANYLIYNICNRRQPKNVYRAKKNSLEKVKNLLKCHITTVIKFIQLHAVLLYQYPYDTNEKTVKV